jgi:predicted metal-dependent phosphotriesterase family hydrolase
MSVLTVTGPIDPSEIAGICLCSEHLFYDALVSHPGLAFDPSSSSGNESLRLKPVTIDILGHLRCVVLKDFNLCFDATTLIASDISRSEDPYACIDNTVLSCEQNAEAEIRAFKEAGGSLIVDTTPIGCGRNPRYQYGFCFSQMVCSVCKRPLIGFIAGHCEGFRSPQVPLHKYIL